MATNDLASITSQVPGEEQLMLRKVVGKDIPPCVIPAAELTFYCYPALVVPAWMASYFNCNYFQ